MTTMSTSNRPGRLRLARPLLAGALAAVVAAPAMAQDVGSLVTYRPDNRAGSVAAATVIAEMIAERSESAAVRSRARSLAPAGALTVGAEELLLDIGANAHVAAVTGRGGVVPAAVAPAPPRVAPPPVVETAVTPPAPVPPASAPASAAAAAPAATSAAAPTPTPTPSASAASPRRSNWGISESFSSEMSDRGGSGGGGGGGGWN